jgi:predicted ArsR family transcriptional regulator
VLEERMTTAELESLLREVGRRLAVAQGALPADARARADLAATVLTELGGVVDVERHDGTTVLRGYSCPLADAVRAHPGTCQAVESLVAELVGGPVRERCDRGERPRCCFELVSGPA